MHVSKLIFFRSSPQKAIHSSSSYTPSGAVGLSTQMNSSSIHLPISTFATTLATSSSVGSQSHGASGVASVSSSSNKQPYVPYSSIGSLSTSTTRSSNNLYTYEDGPVSMPFSHIPPIRETQQTNNNALNNIPVYQSTPNYSSSSYHPSKNTLNLQLVASPTRSGHR